MDCEGTQDLLVDYLYGELTPAEREVFERHLGECPACAQEAEALSGVLEMVRSQPTEEPSAEVSQRILHAARAAVAHRSEQEHRAPKGFWAWLASPVALSAAAAAALLVMVTVGLTVFDEEHPPMFETMGAPAEAIQPVQAQKDLELSAGAGRPRLTGPKEEEKKEKGQLSTVPKTDSKPAKTPVAMALDSAREEDEGGTADVRTMRPAKKARKRSRPKTAGRSLTEKPADRDSMDQSGSAIRPGTAAHPGDGTHLQRGQPSGGIAALGKSDRSAVAGELQGLRERGKKRKPKSPPPAARPEQPEPSKPAVVQPPARGPVADAKAQPAPAPADKPAPERRLFAQPPPAAAGDARAEPKGEASGGASADVDGARFAKRPVSDESSKDAKPAAKAKKRDKSEWYKVEQKKTAATRAQAEEGFAAEAESDDAAQQVRTADKVVAASAKPSDPDRSSGRFSQAERALADGNYPAAAAGYQTYLKAQPRGPRAADARFGYARALFLSGRCDRAEGAIKKAVARHPRHRMAADALFDLASCHVRKGRFELAVQVYNRIGRDFPARQGEALRERSRIAPEAPAAAPASER